MPVDEDNPGPPTPIRVVAHAAAVWMVVFAVVHLYWSVGGTALLPAGLTVPDVLPLLIIDIVAVPLSLAGAVLALALVRPWGARIGRRRLLLLGWGVAAVALVHSTPTVVLELARLVGLRDAVLTEADMLSAWVYEPWWFLGGVLFAVATWGSMRASRGRVAREQS